MADVIMLLDMVHVHRGGDAGVLIKVTHIVGKVRVIGNAPQVAFEMPDIDGVKTDQCRKQPPVRLGKLRPKQVTLA